MTITGGPVGREGETPGGPITGPEPAAGKKGTIKSSEKRSVEGMSVLTIRNVGF